MKKTKKARHIAEFGDFQTPPSLATGVCKRLSNEGVLPRAIVEPTCGVGNFLLAALDAFPSTAASVGLEINGDHLSRLHAELSRRDLSHNPTLLHADFFATDWPALLDSLPEPLLIIGNPPWVTNAELGALGSTNLPKKSNFQNRSGFDALTGKSNFDISEWMLLHFLEWLDGRHATLAMLCKTTVARKVLAHSWKNSVHIEHAQMFSIDAAVHFNAAVHACLLVCKTSPDAISFECEVYNDIGEADPTATIGYRDGELVADVTSFDSHKHLRGNSAFRWRSGIKHDCSSVMELRRDSGAYRNGLDELVDIEASCLYPMLKSSDLANGDSFPRRWMLVTQHTVGEETSPLRESAPKTWAYLEAHGHLLDKRGSSIYRNRPRFSVFGVGPYSFAPWKVAISGFYKRLRFRVVGPHDGVPVVFDDTIYFLPCDSQEEASYLASLLNSERAAEFFSAYIFWDAKRPITVDLLKRLDLIALAKESESETTIRKFLDSPTEQAALF